VFTTFTRPITYPSPLRRDARRPRHPSRSVALPSKLPWSRRRPLCCPKLLSIEAEDGQLGLQLDLESELCRLHEFEGPSQFMVVGVEFSPTVSRLETCLSGHAHPPTPQDPPFDPLHTVGRPAQAVPLRLLIPIFECPAELLSSVCPFAQPSRSASSPWRVEMTCATLSPAAAAQPPWSKAFYWLSIRLNFCLEDHLNAMECQYVYLFRCKTRGLTH
jgi:hypothetical protein